MASNLKAMASNQIRRAVLPSEWGRGKEQESLAFFLPMAIATFENQGPAHSCTCSIGFTFKPLVLLELRGFVVLGSHPREGNIFLVSAKGILQRGLYYSVGNQPGVFTLGNSSKTRQTRQAVFVFESTQTYLQDDWST